MPPLRESKVTPQGRLNLASAGKLAWFVVPLVRPPARSAHGSAPDVGLNKTLWPSVA
jgi:hypothetical protein